MTPAERSRHMKTIIDQHSEAVRAFRTSSDAFDHAMLGIDESMGGFKQTFAAVQEASQAQREAMDAIIAANRAALTLFNEE